MQIQENNAYAVDASRFDFPSLDSQAESDLSVSLEPSSVCSVIRSSGNRFRVSFCPRISQTHSKHRFRLPRFVFFQYLFPCLYLP